MLNLLVSDKRFWLHVANSDIIVFRLGWSRSLRGGGDGSRNSWGGFRAVIDALFRVWQVVLRLIRVELTGFKSFAQTEAVDLERPVTAIVGPNGSGKSNILDSILFAFGEQSPIRLRTSKMDSLIFGGAGDLKRLNYTGVKLTFAPAFQESLSFKNRPEIPGISVGGNGASGGNGKPKIDGFVTLERRLYRDGVSEYYLNGEQARLRDVDEFFGLLGLGRGSTIAITQGEVEKKILANPQEMRQWLVSACGIGLLIDKKRRTEDKLGETRNNLERVSDLISATRRRVEILAREREDAIEFSRLDAELKALKRESLRRELSECFHQIGQHYEVIREIRAKIEDFDKAAESAEELEETLEAKYNDARSEVERLLESLGRVQKSYDNSTARIGALEVELEMLADKEAGLAIRKEETEKSIVSGSSHLDSLEKEVEILSAKRIEIEKALAAAEKTLETAEKAAEAARIENQRTTEELLDFERALLETENRLGLARSSMERVNAAGERLSRELARDETAAGELRGRAASLEFERVAEMERVRSADAEAAKAVENLEQCRASFSRASEVRDEVRDTLAAVDARLKSLRALEEEAEGFAPGKRAFLTDAKLKEKVRGVSDLWKGLDFPQELSGAVYLVLSQFEDAVEVGDVAAGIKALADFHKSGIGKARLVEVAQGASVPERPDWWPENAARFFELVSGGNGRLARMFAEIGEVAVCRTIEDAEKLLLKTPQLSWAVLRDGSVMIGRGQAIGGAPSAGSRVLSRRSQIDELAKDANRLGVDWAAAEAQVKRANESVQAAQADLDARIEQKSRHLKELAVIDERFSSLKNRTEELELSVCAIKLELENTAAEKAELGALIEKRESEVREKRAAIEKASGASGKASKAYEKAELALREAREILAKTNEEKRVTQLGLSHLEAQISEASSRVSEAERQLSGIASDLAEVRSRSTEAGKMLETEVVRRVPGENEIADFKSKLEGARSDADAAKAELEKAKTKVRNESGELERLNRDLSKFEVSRGRLLYRYYDLWVNWHGAVDEPKKRQAEDGGQELISPETEALFSEAILLFGAWAESQGIKVEMDGSALAGDGGENGESEDGFASASYSELEAMNAELRSITEGAEANSRADNTPDGEGDENPEQLELAEAPENVISRWEAGALPKPPAPPLSIESLEKMGRLRLREKVGEAEESIRALGEVNLKAPGQWEEESSRLRFFLLQHADMQAALAQLTELLAKLDRDTLKRYTSRTGRITERFQEYFKFLFGGGAVAIKFTEPDDVLASGVEVMVTLPGERTQPLRSLSGGERSLVFLALFLAAHSIGESAFCIMDEADAALDDANILRLGKLVNAIAAHTQFILVTHNKRTMELADGLIGVVGRPKGVSRIIPVDLAGAEKYAEAGVAGR